MQMSAYAGITWLFNPLTAFTYAANEKLDMACIGAGGQAGAGIGPGMSQNLIAIAEVDPDGKGKENIAKVLAKSPDTKIYTDYRKLFDAHPKLDAVWCGTPDHNHFGASIRALNAGAGVYCEKPLTWSIWEARRIREVAIAKKAATQMGNQGHSSGSIREICEHIWAGNLGDVKTVHCISNRNFSAGDKRPDSKPVPKGLDWEAWLGPATFRDYHDGLHSFSWRGYRDFGTGSLGDMACHTIDGAVWALKLNEAESFEVEAELRDTVNKNTQEGHAKQAVIVYKFPKRGEMPPVTLTWYHGGQKMPRPEALEEGRPLLSEGTYYLGDKATMCSGSHCGDTQLVPKKLNDETPKPKQVLPRSKGHDRDFIDACKNKNATPPSGNFDYSSRLTEIVLAGNLAIAVNEKITYSLKDGKTNNDKANALLKREPRKGWELGYEERA
jgi:predicted dehydrogenase